MPDVVSIEIRDRVEHGEASGYHYLVRRIRRRAEAERLLVMHVVPAAWTRQAIGAAIEGLSPGQVTEAGIMRRALALI